MHNYMILLIGYQIFFVFRLGARDIKETSGWVFLVTLAATLGGAVIGAVLRRFVPGAHLNTETRDVVRLGVGLLATLSAVAISLMIASARTSYDTQDAHFRQFSANVDPDRPIAGADTGRKRQAFRKLMRQAIPAALDRIWAEKAIGAPQATRSRQAPPPSRFTMRSRR